MDAVLDATEELAFASGIGSVTVPSIARRSGVAQGSIFDYFPTKEAIVAAWAERTWRRALEAAVAAVPLEREGVVARVIAALNGVLWPYARATVGLHFGDVLGRREVRTEIFGAVATLVESALDQHAALVPKPPANRNSAGRLVASVLASDLYLEWLAANDDLDVANHEVTTLVRRYLVGS